MMCHGKSKAVVGKDSRSCKRPVPFVGIRTMGNPVVRREVHSFPDIWSVTEPSMKGSGERNDVFTLVLDQFVNRDVSIQQQPWTELRSDVVQQVRDVPHLRTEVTLEDFFEPVRIPLCPRDAVPLFRCTLVMVVDTVQVIILVVPTERREQRPVIHPRDVDAVDPDLDVPEDTVGSVRHVVEIPPRFFVVVFCTEFRFRLILLLPVS
mmetsp:Transcript_7333/g.17966  ORF Transcript_7333/g.17966 Transcript_7333/m.17966 type:complete len:207 (+) Transcript_7333:938-1558(+)